MKTLYKYFVFSDVHGEYDALQKGLEEAGYDRYNQTHRLVCLGDGFDRGPHSRKIWNLMYSVPNSIYIKGNHDVMFQEYLEKGMDGEYVLFNILHNGLGETIKSFTGLQDNQFSIDTLQKARSNMGNRREILAWLQNRPLYYETENFIFVHAGINPHIADWKDTDEHYMLWDIEDSHRPCSNTSKIVIIGHHHAFRVRKNAKRDGYPETTFKNCVIKSRLKDENGKNRLIKMESFGNTDEHKPCFVGNKIAIDGCTNLTKKVNILVFEDYEKDEEKEKQQGQTIYMDPNNLYSYSYGYDTATTTTAYTAFRG